MQNYDGRFGKQISKESYFNFTIRECSMSNKGNVFYVWHVEQFHISYNTKKEAFDYIDEYWEKVIDKFPHGSGIDCDWHMEETKKYLKFSNSYHVMNDVGMYVGYQDFTVCIDKTNYVDWKIQFNNGNHLGNYYQLRGYLEDTFAYHFSENPL